MKERRFLDLMDEIEKEHRESLSDKDKIKYDKKMIKYKKRAERYLEKTLNGRTTAVMGKG